MTEERRDYQEILNIIKDGSKEGAREGAREGIKTEVNGGVKSANDKISVLSDDFKAHIKNHEAWNIASLVWQKEITQSIWKLQIWQATVLGGLAIVTALVIPLVVYNFLKLDGRISNLEDVFTNYNIQVIE